MQLEKPALLKTSLLEPENLLNSNAYYAAMREHEPVRYDEKAGMYLISGYDDLMTIVRDSVTYSVGHAWNKTFAPGLFDEFKAILERDGGGYFPDAIMTDPPTHTRVRALMQAAFSPSRIKALEPSIREHIAQLVAAVATRGSADGVTDIAMPMAVGIMCEQVGIDHADGPKVAQWLTSFGSIRTAQSREAMIADAKHFCDLQNYVIERVRERQACRTDDMISDLIYARSNVDGEPVLSFNEVVSLTRAVTIGGLDTIAGTLSNLLLLVATDPAIAASLEGSLEDDYRLSRFVEEVLRIDTPARGLFRMNTKEVELSGVRIPEGSMMCLLFASANNDESVFEEPRKFDMDRKHLSRHLTVGGGAHICIGMHLARMEIKVAAQEIGRRLTDIRLAVPVEDLRYSPSLAVLGLENLPLTFSQRN
jgi:cytochrome P450